jgi:hypothetical protein
MTTIAVGNRRLLKLADILSAIPKNATNKRGEPAYTQDTWTHPCGSPACALGWWAAANPRRWEPATPHSAPILKATGESGVRAGETEFALTEDEALDFFAWYGMGHGVNDDPGNVVTGKKAAAYIRRFVAKRGVK